MLKNMMDWQVMKVDDSETGQLYAIFGERYDFTPSEKEVLRLYMLFGFDDEEIIAIMQTTPQALENHLTCMLGKTRTNSARELQALFVRYILQKLPT